MPGFSLALLLSSGAFGPATDSFLVKLLPLCSYESCPGWERQCGPPPPTQIR